MDQLPRLGKRELICLLSFTCNYVVSVWKGFLFLWVLGMGYVILLSFHIIILVNFSARFKNLVGCGIFTIMKYNVAPRLCSF